MYIPKHFREEDPEKIAAFIEEYPFGILLSSENDEIMGTHIPFLLERSPNGFRLIAHLAAANHQLDHFKNKPDCMVVFQGPHAYVSPSLYEKDHKIPTWNFIAVHLYGELRVVNDFDTKLNILERTISTFEAAYFDHWEKLDKNFRNKVINGMTGLEIEVFRTEAKYKLSQNKTEATRERVTQHFEKEDAELGKYMREMGDGRWER